MVLHIAQTPLAPADAIHVTGNLLGLVAIYNGQAQAFFNARPWYILYAVFALQDDAAQRYQRAREQPQGEYREPVGTEHDMHIDAVV